MIDGNLASTCNYNKKTCGAFTNGEKLCKTHKEQSKDRHLRYLEKRKKILKDEGKVRCRVCGDDAVTLHYCDKHRKEHNEKCNQYRKDLLKKRKEELKKFGYKSPYGDGKIRLGTQRDQEDAGKADVLRNLNEINEGRILAGLVPIKPKNRNCLNCHKKFISIGFNDRLCYQCNDENEEEDEFQNEQLH